EPLARFPLSSVVAALNRLSIMTQQHETSPRRRRSGDKRMPAFTDKVALTACCTFIVLAVSRALPLYQNIRSDSPAKSAHSTTITT
ncbi:hypothetical protein ABVT39_007318, partial [Epinephelus coioides]